MILGCCNQLLRHCYKPHSQSYPWKTKHFLVLLEASDLSPRGRRGHVVALFYSQQSAQLFFSPSVWKALRFVFVGIKPHDSQKKKIHTIRSEANRYETRDDR